MGIDVQIESETGEVEDLVADVEDLTEQLLPGMESSPCLRWVDPYGDTIFNQIQIPHLVTELEGAASVATEPNVRAHAEAVLKLVRRAKAKIHTYVRFVGD